MFSDSLTEFGMIGPFETIRPILFSIVILNSLVTYVGLLDHQL